MKFPCHSCKAIRTFAGEPPKCDVCGWEWADASGRETADTPREAASLWAGEEKVGRGILLRIGFLGFLMVGAIFLAAQYLAPGKRPSVLGQTKYAIALKYNLTEDLVFMEAKPKECDFTEAPLGDKHCHFEQELNVVRECVTLSGVPAAPEANCPVKRVYVSWRKVRD